MANHGGKRAGSGRKKKEPTKTIRVPISLEKEVLQLISDHKQGKKTKVKVSPNDMPVKEDLKDEQKTPKKNQKPITKKSGISEENKAIIFTLYDQVEIGNLSIERVVDNLRVDDITTARGYEWTVKNLNSWITNHYYEYRKFIAEKEKKEQTQ